MTPSRYSPPIERLVLAAVLCLLPWFTTLARAAEPPLKVGFVYVSPTGDAGWTYMHDLARRKLESHFGERIETSYVDNVPEGADAERVIRNLAQKGHNLIFATSFGYMNSVMKVARQFPRVKFEHATGYKQSRNVGVYLGREYQGRYLNGIIAGAMSESDVLGFVAAFPIPEVVRDINAFLLGARVTNPDATVRVIWVNSWHDPAREREAAETLIHQGADVLANHTDSPAVVQTAEANDVYSVGFNSDLQAFGPNTQLTATVFNWFPLYRETAQAVLDGDWESSWRWQGLAEDVIQVTPVRIDAVPGEVVALMKRHKQALVAGETNVFAGPIRDVEGELRIAGNESADDSMLLQMDWFVDGVKGNLDTR